MANLVFKLGDTECSLVPIKIERKKLYGWTDTIALDDEGNECKLVSMDESGTVIIPKGCVGLGMVDKNSEWVERSELMAVDADGSPLAPLPSSFAIQIELKDTVTIEEFLNYNITAVYELDGVAEYPELVAQAAKQIYTFTYNYREGYEGNQAFIIENGGKLFVLVGIAGEFPFIGLEESGYLDEASDEEEDAEDDIDFSMI